MTTITLLECTLVVVGALACIGTTWAVTDAFLSRGVLAAARVNGRKQRSANMRIVREGCRWWASVTILVAGVAFAVSPDLDSWIAVTAKASLLSCGLAMLITIGVDWYGRITLRGDG